MNEFSTPITEEQKAFLTANKAELCVKDSGKAIWQYRIKMASEMYQELKAIESEYDLTDVDIKGDEDEDDEVESSYTDWATFRDNFILDWIDSRTVVNEKEADMIFERTADEALAVIEQVEATSVSEEAAGLEAEASNETAAPAKVARKRKTASKKVAKSKKTAPRKAAAKKKAGGSASAKAQVIIEKYAAKDWSRKEIIEKLQNQLGMGAAYASTLYQKFA